MDVLWGLADQESLVQIQNEDHSYHYVTHLQLDGIRLGLFRIVGKKLLLFVRLVVLTVANCNVNTPSSNRIHFVNVLTSCGSK